MKRALNALVTIAAASSSGLLLAAEDAAYGGDKSLTYLAAALAIGIATFASATSQGKATSTAVEGICRNPTAKDQVFQPLIIGLILMEFQALLGFVIAIILTGK